MRRAFKGAQNDLRTKTDDRLRSAAELVADDAERLASTRISKIGPKWSRMRVGLTSRSSYVAPKQRPTKVAAMKRKKIATRLMDEAMQPALDENTAEVRREMDRMLADLERDWGRGG